MSVQRSTAARDAANDSFEAVVGVAPLLRLRTGTKPANCAASRSGTILATITLPSDWLSASSAGVKAKLGSWVANASASGAVGYYEIMDSTGTTCHEQGTAGTSGTDMITDVASTTSGQPVTVTAYAMTAGNP